MHTLDDVDHLQGLRARLHNVFYGKWAKKGVPKPVISFDKESCCKPPANKAHNSWWAQLVSQDFLRLTGSGQSLVEALQDLLNQLSRGPPEGVGKLSAEDARKLRLTAKKQTKIERKKQLLTASVQQPQIATPVLDFNTFFSVSLTEQKHLLDQVVRYKIFEQQPNLADEVIDMILEMSNAELFELATNNCALRNKLDETTHIVKLQSDKSSSKNHTSSFDDPKAITRDNALSSWPTSGGSSCFPQNSFRSAALQSGFGSKPATVISQPQPSKFTFGTSNVPSTQTSSLPVPKFGSNSGNFDFLASFKTKAAAQEMKEFEKLKVEDMDSDEDEGEWERKDAEKRAQRHAEFMSHGKPFEPQPWMKPQASAGAGIFSTKHTYVPQRFAGSPAACSPFSTLTNDGSATTQGFGIAGAQDLNAKKSVKRTREVMDPSHLLVQHNKEDPELQKEKKVKLEDGI